MGYLITSCGRKSLEMTNYDNYYARRITNEKLRRPITILAQESYVSQSITVNSWNKNEIKYSRIGR